MTGFDLFLAALFVIAIAIETRRGFGRAIFDLLALYTGLLLNGYLTPIVARTIPGITASSSGYADCQIVTYVVIVVILLIIARFTAAALLWNLGMFDNLGGMAAGAVAATIFCHGLVAAMAVGGNHQVAELSGNFSQQLLTFSSYHQVMDGLNSAMSSHPDPSQPG